MSQSRKDTLVSLALPGLVTAALLALVGWVYTTGNRVTALETRIPSLEENVQVIRQDVREIRDWVIPKPPPGAR